MKNVILINGKARSGKDTLAQMLKIQLEKMGLRVLVKSNAESVKHTATLIFNWNGEKDDKGRKLLLDITDTGYNYDKNFWERMTREKFVGNDVYIIPDWRYNSTYEFFNKEDNVITINIKNDNRESIGNLSNHYSETGLDNFKFDYYVYNNEGLLVLEAKAKILTGLLMNDLNNKSRKDFDICV